MLLTKIYCNTDDFVKKMKKYYQSLFLPHNKIRKVREPELSLSEIMTIIIYFHFSKYRPFKNYYLN